ncbi:MAG TPA: MopE-related protein, partial [candidate division Zixibacteria bacterium]|nr:MopE-related protein [candidate division Zixibacteria bacterium]
MKRARLLLLPTLCAATLTLTAQPARSFEYLGAAWCCDTIRWCIGEGVYGQIDPGKVCGPASTSWYNAVNAAVNTWNNQGTAFRLWDGHLTPSTACAPDGQDSCRFAPTQDGQNTISVAADCDLPAGFLAVAMVWTNTSTCCITEADICFNSFRNQSDFWWLGLTVAGCITAVGCFDAQTVATHELGHWVGLGHEDDNIGGVKQVMHSATGICDLRRQLTPDDAAGLDYVHGATTVLQQPARCQTVHTHPTYATSTKEPLSGGCGFAGCIGSCTQPPGTDFDGDGFCDSLDNCVVIWNRNQADSDGDNYGDVCDCNPTNAAVNPGATELCANGVDDDCNGLTDSADPACGVTPCCTAAGDFDNSGVFNIGDVTAGIAYIFSGGAAPACCEEADFNGDGS